MPALTARRTIGYVGGIHPECPGSDPPYRLPADVFLRHEPDEEDEEDEDEDEGDRKDEDNDDDDVADDGYSE
ncbi:MAG: hypothetical protein WCC04_16890 [Terriglobales bacterium]